MPGEPTIAVNLAPHQLGEAGRIGRVLAVLAETGLPPRRFEAEVTESSLVGDLEAARRAIAALKEAGVRVALDDFGTGYSSLTQLAELPFDKIKIDRSFVRTFAQGQRSAAIVAAIVGLGRSLGLPTIAEGVETAADARRLRAAGCDQGQGYHFARPMPAAEVDGLLAREAASGSARPA